jgi:hypothetical protein
MRFTQVICAAALTAAVYANPTPANADAGADSTTLSANAIQSGSFNNGQEETGAEAGEATSLTSTNNFINNCAGKTLTNGLQITTGSCNGITMGDIPAKTNMVSTIILNPPQGGAAIPSDTTFNITLQTANLVAGSFTNADATYYAAPQFLSGGSIVGHTHVTVQDLGANLNPTAALDATQFAFFKGINDAGNGKGLLSAEVTGGLPAGNYRVCTLASASNHQPVLMPVAQRGSSDDCTKFVVSGSGTTINVAANDGSKGIAAAAAAASAVAVGPDVDVSSSTVAAVASTSTTAAADAASGKGSAQASAASAASKAGSSGKATASGAAVSKGGAAASKAGAAAAKGGAAASKGGAAAAKGGKQGRRAKREFIA